MQSRIITISVWILLLLLGGGMVSLAQTKEEQEILFYTNKYRKSKGKPPLKLESAICQIARDHSEGMAKGKVSFGHSGFDGRAARVKKKYGEIQAAAENVAYGQLSPEEVVKMWIKSPGHRKNLLGDYNLIGIGDFRARDGTIYFTQVFIKKE